MTRLRLVSQTLKSELDHFEADMMAELEMSCMQYKEHYSRAVILINTHFDNKFG